MKAVSILVLLLGFLSMNAQSEFAVQNNGLIYTDKAVSELKHIVDSLNLKFRICENRTFFASKQARVHAIELSGIRSKELRKDIESGVGFDKVLVKYPRASVEKDLLLLVLDSEDYDGRPVTVFETVEIGESAGNRIEMDRQAGREKVSTSLKGKWVFDSRDKTQYSDASVIAFYFVTEVASPQLPDPYSRMISYADCLIDTTAQIFDKNAGQDGQWNAEKQVSAADEFVAAFDKATKRPRLEFERVASLSPEEFDKEYDKFAKTDSVWRQKYAFRRDSILKADPDFLPRLKRAVADAKKEHRSNRDFETLVAQLLPLSEALELKRNRIVIGGCSKDQAPRLHAQQIALLAAETTRWEIFLRAHLDIMNDRFERVSDGSYAWNARHTYIRELEVLDIDVPSLIFGISFRVENAAQNHYYGSIGRTGRALAESKDKSRFADQMLQIISDRNLDDYNRLLMFYMFDNYNYNLADREEQLANLGKLKTAVASMPDYVSSRLKIQDYNQD